MVMAETTDDFEEIFRSPTLCRSSKIPSVPIDETQETFERMLD